MTQAPLTSETLSCLKLCRGVAIDNLRFYEKLYDGLDEDTTERDSIGQALAQKQSFIGAANAILNNHDIDVASVPLTEPLDCDGDVLKEIETGEHLKQEERFCSALQSCTDLVDDEIISELLEHHFEAAKIAVAALKSTSLKI